MSIRNLLGDRRLIYVFIFLTVGLPLLYPLGLPLLISDETRSFYEEVNNLQEGATVYFGIDFISVSAPELEPMTRAVLKHLLIKQVKIIIISFASIDGPSWSEKILETTNLGNKKYGEDYVTLGYFAGGETAIANFAADFRNIVSTDFAGTPIDQLQILEGLNNANDFDLFMIMASDYLLFLRQIQDPYNAKMILGTSSPEYAQAKTFYESGQIIGLLNGMRGAAEYEVLVQQPGAASSGMDAQSITQLFVIVAILIGNIQYFRRKSAR